MEAKQVKQLMEAYASVYAQPEEVIAEAECECEDEKEGEESMEMEGEKKSKKKKVTSEEAIVEGDLQQTVDTALKAGQKFMKTNPVGKALGAVIAPVGAGRGTVTAAEQQKKVQQNVKTEEVEYVGEAKKIAHGTGKKVMPSAKERSALAKKARAGKDIGKPGKGFEKVAAKAAKQYGSKEAGERVAAAAMFKAQAKEEVETDLFDVILEYLVAEGYADTNKTALAIMANMSEEWKHSIVEQMTVNVADVKGGTQAAKNAQAGMKGKDGQPLYKPGVGVGPDFKLKGV